MYFVGIAVIIYVTSTLIILKNLLQLLGFEHFATMGKGQLHILLLLSDALTFSGQYHAYPEVYHDMIGYSPGSVRVLLNRLVRAGQTEKILKNGKAYFCLTARGIKTLKSLLALERGTGKWDGKWRLLIKSKPHTAMKFPFKRLQNEVYISPFVHDERELFPYGYFIEAKSISPLENTKLANLIWSLDTIKKSYLDWLKKAQHITKDQLGEIVSQYEVIVAQDPFLPKQLLPKEWYFEKARERLIRLIKDYFSNRKM